MTNGPRVSIGMPVYNGENFLRETLDSLLAQTLADFELVISDNASTDGTEDICREYAARDQRIRYLRQDENRGAAWNHNQVVQAARGEWFKLACHDDTCAPSLVERCVQALKRRPDAVLAHPTTMMLDADTGRLQTYTSEMHLDSPVTALRFGDLIDEAPPSFPLFGLIRMRALRAALPFGGYKASDRVVLARLALLGPFAAAPEAVLHYRWHASNASRLMDDPDAFYRWWDPKRRARRSHPETRLLWEYLRSLWRVALSLEERRQCAREILLWYQAQKPVIHWELRRLYRAQADAPPPAGGYFARLARRARRRDLRRRLYPQAG